MATRSARSLKIDIRVSPEAKEALSRAAALSRRSLSEFVLDSALTSAEETLANRTYFILDDEKWGSFIAALDAPPKENMLLKKLISSPGPYSGEK
jgi:uncharacterized protein (DUF1778 family)